MSMTPAELRTKRQAIGLTPKHIAERAGVHHNVVWRAESSASARVSEAAQLAHAAYDGLAAEFYDAVHTEEKASRKRGHIERARDAAEFAKLHPTLASWPERSIGLFYAEVERRTHLPIEYTQE